MSNGIQFNVDGVRKSGKDLTEAADQLKSEADAFGGNLDGYGNPFGDDDLGSMMKSVYDVAYQSAMDCLKENTTVIADTAEEVVAMADEYSEIDTANGEEFAKISEGLGK